MLITKEIEIDLCHRVCYHKSKCRNLHWHRYKIEAGVEWDVISEKFKSDYGMVIDYWDLKQIMLDELDVRFDHWAIFYNEDPYKEKLIEMMDLWDQDRKKLHFVDFMPTAENLCEYWFGLIEIKLLAKWIKLKHVKVWETPTSTAIFIK